jgi:heat shock protein HslJ
MLAGMSSDSTADLVVGSLWDVVEVEGAPVLAGTSPQLQLDAEGRVAGRATVNRLMGSYTLTGDVLVLGPLATTMMMGPEDHMQQEQRVLTALQRELRVAPGDTDDELLLVSEAGTTRLRLAADTGGTDTDGSDADAADGTEP